MHDMNSTRQKFASAFTLTTLRNEEILGMSLEIAEKLKGVAAVVDSAQGKAFLDAIPVYAAALDMEKVLTYKDLVQADAAVDQAVSGLRAHLQALLGYPDDDTREAARQLWNAIDQYGNPTQLNFQEEYAIVARMLETIKAFDPAIAVTATVSAWLPALRSRYDAFMAMMKSYDTERAAVVPGTVKNARQTLTATWKPLCDFINGLAIVSPCDALENLIAEMNARIQSKKTALKQRKSAKKTAKEVAEDSRVVVEE